MVTSRERVGGVSHKLPSEVGHAEDIVLRCDDNKLRSASNVADLTHFLALLISQCLLKVRQADELAALEIVQEAVTLDVLLQASGAGYQLYSSVATYTGRLNFQKFSNVSPSSSVPDANSSRTATKFL